MERKTIFLLLFKILQASSKEDDLPLCPANIQFFPQNLPMHCRMPNGAEYPPFPGLGSMPMPTVPPGQPPFFPLPPGDNKHPGPFPMALPGMPPGMPPGLPPGLPHGAIPVPGSMPMPVPGGPQQKLPVIVMPFYSQDPSYNANKKSRHHHQKGHGHFKKAHGHARRKPIGDDSSDTDTDTDTDTDSTDTSSDTSSDKEYWKGYKRGFRRNGRRARKSMEKKKKQLLTPILQYVTNDGYVIFEKKISKDEATDWLKTNDEDKNKERVDVEYRHDEKEIVRNKQDNELDELREELAEATKKEKATTHKVHPQRIHHQKSNPK